MSETLTLPDDENPVVDEIPGGVVDDDDALLSPPGWVVDAGSSLLCLDSGCSPIDVGSGDDRF